MKNEKLIVKNFLTLKNIDIDLAKFNVFIGEQASGKSLITKLLYFFREILITYIPTYPQELNAIGKILYARFSNIFNNPNLTNTEIIYSFGNHSIYMDIKNQSVLMSNSLAKLYLGCVAQLNIDNAYRSSLKILQPPKAYSILLNKIYNTNYDYLKINSKFLPAERVIFFSLFNNIFNLINTQQLNLNPLLMEFGQNYQQAFSAFKSAFVFNSENVEMFEKFTTKIIKGKYIYDQLGGFIEQGELQTRLADSSSGQQEFLPVYIILRDMLAFYHGNLYIEEPEAHLYPTAQKDILELLVYVVNAINSEGLYITTHSPYILTVLNNLIIANEIKNKQTDFEPNLLVPFEDVRAYFIAEGTAHSLMNEEYRIIDAEKLDEVSNTISSEYSKMVDLL